MLELGAIAGEVEVWPENAAVVDAFLTIASQWRTAGGGMGPIVYLGLDYTAAIAGITAAGIGLTPETWSGVRVMEGAAREALNEKRT